MKTLLLPLLLLLDGCSSSDPAKPQESPQPEYEWQCFEKTVSRGAFCDCQRGPHALPSSQRTCGEAPCCYTGAFSDGTEECICHSQEFRDADGTTCEATVESAGKAAGSTFLQVLSCPPQP